MEYRPLGRTGVQVSRLCPGTMMLGAWGTTDLDPADTSFGEPVLAPPRRRR